uniref:Epithelial membrane protein 1 n=1 Tax=Electrophorus electricus TaxID=8005 RepID=A0AAY5EH46_ELEEL
MFSTLVEILRVLRVEKSVGVRKLLGCVFVNGQFHTHTHTRIDTQHTCTHTHRGTVKTSHVDWYLQAVQASSILACVFSGLGLVVFMVQLFTLPKGKRFTFSGIFQLLACLCIMIAASIYTEIFHSNEGSSYGPCFIMAWMAFVLTFISCLIYFILRKKTT